MAGHASITTTLNRYGHLFPDDLELAAARLAAANAAAVIGAGAGAGGAARAGPGGASQPAALPPIPHDYRDSSDAPERT